MGYIHPRHPAAATHQRMCGPSHTMVAAVSIAGFTA
jgi:hypothetical protein